MQKGFYQDKRKSFHQINSALQVKLESSEKFYLFGDIWGNLAPRFSVIFCMISEQDYLDSEQLQKILEKNFSDLSLENKTTPKFPSSLEDKESEFCILKLNDVFKYGLKFKKNCAKYYKGLLKAVSEDFRPLFKKIYENEEYHLRVLGDFYSQIADTSQREEVQRATCEHCLGLMRKMKEGHYQIETIHPPNNQPSPT